MRWQSYGTRGMYPTIRVVTGEGSKKVARQGLLNIPIIRPSFYAFFQYRTQNMSAVRVLSIASRACARIEMDELVFPIYLTRQ
jgi:hypothetical protein